VENVIPAPTILEIVFSLEKGKTKRSFLLKDTFLAEILIFAAKKSRRGSFSIEILEDGIPIEGAIPTTSNSEEIKNLKIFLRNYYSTNKHKKLLLKNLMEFKFSLI
jgi:hypothetical protein